MISTLPQDTVAEDTVLIEKLVSGGDGLGHLDGHTIFVPLTAPGDVVIPTDVRKARKVLFAGGRELVTGSDERREAPCPWFGECGGCQWMHLPYPAQLMWKETVFSETVKRIARFSEVAPEKIHGSSEEFGYRHRIRLKYDGKGFGFYRRGSRQVVPWERCMLLPDLLNRAVGTLRKTVKRSDVQGLLKNLELAVDPAAEALTALWIFEPGKRSMRSGSMERIKSALVSDGVNLVGQDVGTVNRPAVSRNRDGALRFKVAGEPMKASPGTFLQANPAMNEILVERVAHHLGPGHDRTLLDLYCGNGNFSIPAAVAGFRVTGVESSPGAVQDAMECAPEGCRFVSADVARYLARSARSAGSPGSKKLWDVVMVDPPRTGLPAEVVGQLAGMGPELIVYVSCEPSTLARDLARLVTEGYTVRTMELMDMFPQTSHVESLTVLERR
jgi:23S rRNA (uracil1939-C5)-methyltransferase